jgi:hypothetical protein
LCTLPNAKKPSSSVIKHTEPQPVKKDVLTIVDDGLTKHIHSMDISLVQNDKSFDAAGSNGSNLLDGNNFYGGNNGDNVDINDKKEYFRPGDVIALNPDVELSSLSQYSSFTFKDKLCSFDASEKCLGD